MKYIWLLCAVLLFGCLVPPAAAIYDFDETWEPRVGDDPSSPVQFSFPTGIAVNNANRNVYVADAFKDASNMRIVRFGETGVQSSELGGTNFNSDSTKYPEWGEFLNLIDVAIQVVPYEDPYGIGDVYASASDATVGNRILRYEWDAGISYLGGWFINEEESKPIGGLGISSSGDVYVADTGNKQILVFDPVGGVEHPYGMPDPVGQPVLSWGSWSSEPGGTFYGPTDVAVSDATGTVYVADQNRVVMFNQNGEYQGEWKGVHDSVRNTDTFFGGLWGIATDEDDNVIVTDETSKKVWVCSAPDAARDTWDGYQLTGYTFTDPEGIAVGARSTDTESTLFVVDHTPSRVVKFVQTENDPPVITSLTADPSTDSATPLDEGSEITISGSFTDSDTGDTWDATIDLGDGAGEHYLALANDKTFSLKHTYGDNNATSPSYNVTVTVSDGVETDTETIEVFVKNVAPTVGDIIVPLVPVKVGDAVDLTASFTDPGTADTHTTELRWSETAMSAGSVTESDGSGVVTGSFAYASPGIYWVSVNVTDDDGAFTERTAANPVIVYDPSGGFATGGGWFISPEGAYPAKPGLTGKANFSFVSKYRKDEIEPASTVKFEFKAGDLEFESTSNEFIVVSGSNAMYRGTGTLNGGGNYRFLLNVTDGSPDRVRIQIVDTTPVTGGIVYDNEMGKSEYEPPGVAVGGGNVAVHN